MSNLGRRGVLGLAAAAVAGRAEAQAGYPDKPIRMIIAFAAGGPTDILARMLAPRLSEVLGQQIVVENKPGATGNIGTAMVADAKPDGYTILFSASTMAMAPALYGKQVGYDPVNGFEGIAYVASVPLIVVVPADGAKSIGELADMLRKEKGMPQLPDVPTVREALGFPFSINTWYAAYAPKGTPRPIIDKLNAAFNKALKEPEVKKWAEGRAIELIQDSTPASAKKFYDDQMAFWDPIIKQSGAKPE